MPKVVLLAGGPGSGRTHLLAGFLMLCDPGYRERMDTDVLDPSTVPPAGLPAPLVFGATGLTTAQLLWAVADALGMDVNRTEDVYRLLADPLPEGMDTIPVVIPDVDRAGVLRELAEPAKVAAEVLRPLALSPGLRLLADLPRAEVERLAAELAEELPAGQLRVIDLDAAPWADEQGLALQAEMMLDDAMSPLAPELARRAGSPLVVRLAAWSLRVTPDAGAPAVLPASVGDVLDLHAERCGVQELTLRRLLAPLALAGEGATLPLDLWADLASAVAGKDLATDLADGQMLLTPFFDLVGKEGEPPAVALVHPAIADELRERMGGTVREAQRRITTALLATLPSGGPERWTAAGPYVRKQLIGHALEGGILPELLADPGFLLYAEQVPLRAAVEHLAAAGAELPMAARTWLRLAPLFTRTAVGPVLRAALLEHAFRQDGLAAPEFGIELPWRTLWAKPLPGVTALTAGLTPEGASMLVADVGEESAGPVGFDAHTGDELVVDVERMVRPSDEQRAAAGLMLSVGGDYVRVWPVDGESPLAVFLSSGPLGGADLTPDGLLLLADARGVSALALAGTGLPQAAAEADGAAAVETVV
ncbi:ATP-binding protein [Kitasatospora sp. NPDC001175]|uniref:ATP-binding protein n=1 Tax=Kitasatospora sp. NPDC001175 TaxID=3157103 RepID=UPI003CFD75BF